MQELFAYSVVELTYFGKPFGYASWPTSCPTQSLWVMSSPICCCI